MTEEERDIFIARLSGICEESGLTQEQIAKKAGIKSRSTFNNYLNGTSMPDHKLRDFCVAMNCSADYLLGISDKDSISLSGLTDVQAKEIRKAVANYRENNSFLNRTK